MGLDPVIGKLYHNCIISLGNIHTPTQKNTHPIKSKKERKKTFVVIIISD